MYGTYLCGICLRQKSTPMDLSSLVGARIQRMQNVYMTYAYAYDKPPRMLLVPTAAQ